MTSAPQLTYGFMERRKRNRKEMTASFHLKSMNRENGFESMKKQARRRNMDRFDRRTPADA
ncbi:MAG: hypothetical protein ACI4PW_07330 [Alphaproteobacteria bacterium]